MTKLEKILEIGKKRSKILFNYEKYIKNIISIVEANLKDANIYLFGSALNDNIVASSDIDIIIEYEVPKSHMKRAEIIAIIEEQADLPLYHPFQFHLLTEKELMKWKDLYKINPKKIN
ncbi:MAG: nucleotidyltransferase domain-containing protein, partial [Candidatus Lokiarchaeota archaeon]